MTRPTNHQPRRERRPPPNPADPTVMISVTLLASERDDLARWAREAGVSMSTYLRWCVQNEAVQRFLSIAP